MPECELIGHRIDPILTNSVDYGEASCGICGRTYVAADVLFDEEAIEAGAEAVRDLLGGDWRKFNGGDGLAHLVLRAAINAVTKEPT